MFAAETSLFTGSMMACSLAAGFALDARHMGVAPVILAMAIISLVVGAIWVVSLARGGRGDLEPPPTPKLEPEGASS